jgi:hypothetical protein
MVQVKRLGAVGLIAVAALSTVAMEGQAADPATLIQQKIVTQIKVTKPTADHSDIVTAGDVVLLHKDGLMMCSSASTYAFSNTYSNGVLSANYKNRVKDAVKSFGFGHIPVFGGGTSASDAANNGCASRKFVAGEKFWITGVTPQKDGILISTFSDPYPDPSGNQARYYGEIKFPFAKGSVPAPDDFVKTVSEVFTVAPPDDSQGGQGGQGGQSDQGGQPAQAAAPPVAPAPPPAPMADIAPPPPPADTPPPTIALGQTKDQVIAAFGQPARMAKLGAKEILYYKDMKVTLTNGKVSNVE